MEAKLLWVWRIAVVMALLWIGFELHRFRAEAPTGEENAQALNDIQQQTTEAAQTLRALLELERRK